MEYVITMHSRRYRSNDNLDLKKNYREVINHKPDTVYICGEVCTQTSYYTGTWSSERKEVPEEEKRYRMGIWCDGNQREFTSLGDVLLFRKAVSPSF